MGEAERFLELYNQLDAAMRSRLGTPAHIPHAQLIDMLAGQDPVFRNNATRLQSYRALRNSIVHMPKGGSPEPIAEPRVDIVQDYGRLVSYMLRPPTALETIAVREVYSVGWQDKVRKALRTMLDNSYHVLPILGEGRVLEGVFTLTTLAEMLEGQGRVDASGEVTFQAFREACGFGRPRAHILFVAESATITDVEARFAEAFLRRVAVTALLITPTGRPLEPLLGLVTAHDLPSATGAQII